MNRIILIGNGFDFFCNFAASIFSDLSYGLRKSEENNLGVR